MLIALLMISLVLRAAYVCSISASLLCAAAQRLALAHKSRLCRTLLPFMHLYGKKLPNGKKTVAPSRGLEAAMRCNNGSMSSWRQFRDGDILESWVHPYQHKCILARLPSSLVCWRCIPGPDHAASSATSTQQAQAPPGLKKGCQRKEQAAARSRRASAHKTTRRCCRLRALQFVGDRLSSPMAIEQGSNPLVPLEKSSCMISARIAYKTTLGERGAAEKAAIFQM